MGSSSIYDRRSEALVKKVLSNARGITNEQYAQAIEYVWRVAEALSVQQEVEYGPQAPTRAATAARSRTTVSREPQIGSLHQHGHAVDLNPTQLDEMRKLLKPISSSPTTSNVMASAMTPQQMQSLKDGFRNMTTATSSSQAQAKKLLKESFRTMSGTSWKDQHSDPIGDVQRQANLYRRAAFTTSMQSSTASDDGVILSVKDGMPLAIMIQGLESISISIEQRPDGDYLLVSEFEPRREYTSFLKSLSTLRSKRQTVDLAQQSFDIVLTEYNVETSHHHPTVIVRCVWRMYEAIPRRGNNQRFRTSIPPLSMVPVALDEEFEIKIEEPPPLVPTSIAKPMKRPKHHTRRGRVDGTDDTNATPQED